MDAFLLPMHTSQRDGNSWSSWASSAGEGLMVDVSACRSSISCSRLQTYCWRLSLIIKSKQIYLVQTADFEVILYDFAINISSSFDRRGVNLTMISKFHIIREVCCFASSVAKNQQTYIPHQFRPMSFSPEKAEICMRLCSYLLLHVTFFC